MLQAAAARLGLDRAPLLVAAEALEQLYEFMLKVDAGGTDEQMADEVDQMPLSHIKVCDSRGRARPKVHHPAAGAAPAKWGSIVSMKQHPSRHVLTYLPAPSHSLPLLPLALAC